MKISVSKELDIRHSVDVFVAGGGPAGVAAAVMAARTGASVFLVENFGAFGGAGVHALVPAFMNFTDGVNFLAAGIGKEVYDYIAENCPESHKKYCPHGIPVETLKLCYDEMLTKAGVSFAFFTYLTDVICENGTVRYAICCGKGETYAVEAKVFIDCTGDGDLAALAGASFQKGDENGNMMAGTLCGIWNGIDWTRAKGPQNRFLDQAFAEKMFTVEDRHLPGVWKISTNTGGSNAGHVYDVDGTRASSLTDAMVAGRKQLQEYRRYFRKYLPGYEAAELVITGTQIGIRETRRIEGQYQLNLEDFINRANFPDEIGRYSYPVDIHASNSSPEAHAEFEKMMQTLQYRDGESYGIPYRALVAKDLNNVLMAGRCISADRYMQASVRVMPCCFITGQAAGAAAAMAAKQAQPEVAKVNISALQDALKQAGAYLPNHT